MIKARAIYIQKKYGLTPEEYLAIKEAQGHVCKICQMTPIPREIRRKPLQRLTNKKVLTKLGETGPVRQYGGQWATIPNPKPSTWTDGFVVDHCHTSGKVRGLLCNACNTILGMAKDNQTILLSAVNYLNAP